MNLNPTIDQYLLSTCLFTIDEFNSQYQNLSKIELKQLADEKFNEMDICVRIGYPFKQMAHFTVGDNANKNKSKVNHDIYIESRDFKIEVKYLKNWKCSSGTKSASKNWDVYQDDFDWLLQEVREGNQGKRAFIIGWFNCVESFSQLIQLGEGPRPGHKPKVSEHKFCYFPFLTKMKVPTFTTDLAYNYNNAYKPFPVNLIGDVNGGFNCLFLGSEKDIFHFAIYY